MITKKDIVYILLGFAIWYTLSVTTIAKECNRFGWSFDSVFPEPTCNVLDYKVPVDDMYNPVRIFDIREI